MAMFHEDDARIIAAERAAQPRWRKRVRAFIKWTSILAFVMIVCAFALSTISTRHDALKSGIEQYLSDLTGYQAHIGIFNGMRFIPHMRIDIEQVIFVREDGGDTGIVAGIEHVVMASRFMDFIFSRDTVREFEIENMFADAGILDNEKLMIHRAGVTGDGYDPHFMAAGLRGEESFYLRIGMKAVGRKDAPRYRPLREAPFHLALGDFQANGVMKRLFWGGFDFEITLAEDVSAGAKYLFGHLRAINRGGAFTLEGNIGDGHEEFSGAITDDMFAGAENPNFAALSDALKFLRLMPVQGEGDEQ